MTKEQRQQRVLKLLESGADRVTVKELIIQESGASPATANRDINEMSALLEEADAGNERTDPSETAPGKPAAAAAAPTPQAATPAPLAPAAPAKPDPEQGDEEDEDDDKTDPVLTVPASEAGHVHVIQEERNFTQQGVKTSTPAKQIYTVQNFKRFYKNRKALGYALNEYLHTPTGFDRSAYPVDVWPGGQRF